MHCNFYADVDYSKIDQQKYMKQFNGRQKAVRRILDNESNWELVKEEGETKAYRRTIKNSNFYMFRGHTFYKCSHDKIHDIYEYILGALLKGDIELAKKYNPAAKAVKIIHKFNDEGFFMFYFAAATNYKGIADRDFVCIRYKEEDDTGIYVTARSVDDNDDKLFPPEKGTVRGGQPFSSFSLRYTEGGIYMDSIFHTDPKGWIPAFVFNATQSKNAMSVAQIRDDFLKTLEEKEEEGEKTE